MDHILIIDDSATVRAQMSRWLVDMGYEVDVAETGRAALDAVRRESPDLIILDLGLPDMDGLEVCRRLRSEEDGTRIPVVVLTSSEAEPDRIRSLEMGAEDFITKPPSLTELRARIRTLLRAKHLSDRLLISYLEMDRLGSFAETLLVRPISDWTPPEVADAMASQVLAVGRDDPNRPQWIWGGLSTGERMAGATSHRDGERTRSVGTRFDRSALMKHLQPHARGEGEFVSKRPMTPDLSALLEMDAFGPPQNFVAVEAHGRVVIAAGYPWEVGSYELPLLRAMHRHWRVFERLRSDGQRIEEAFFQTMESLAVAAEFYDNGTGLHIRRVGLLSGRMAGLAGRDLHFVKWITQAAKVHDVGKITIPFEILAKPGELTREEMEVMKRHTLNGAHVLEGSPHLEIARSIARSHHENFDGSGYPEGLRGRRIPLEARIVRLMDVYDALRSRRYYKPSLTHEQSIQVLTTGDDRVQPSNFDPDLLDLLVANGDEFAQLHDLIGQGPAGVRLEPSIGSGVREQKRHNLELEPDDRD
jgi:response regulator RpfG family c-di-GMP phosphodiesterase